MACYKHLYKVLNIVFAIGFTVGLNILTKHILLKMKESAQNNPESNGLVESGVRIRNQFLPECNCSRSIASLGNSEAIQSSCSLQALMRGSHQKVISFTFFSGYVIFTLFI